MTRYLLMGTAAALLFFSILCRFFPGMRLKRLLGETANLSVSPNTILRQCVLKYSSLCELNGGRMNTSVYVEKFLRQLKFGRFSLRFWDRLGGQLLLLSVFADGIGACMGLMGGQTLGNVIWFYLQAFFESVSVFCGDWDDRYGVDGRGTENHAGGFSGKPYVGAAGAGKAGITLSG